MNHNSEVTGAPYGDEHRGSADEWSEAIYDLLKDWPPAKTGRWTLWPGDYLLLDIEQVEGRPVELARLWTSDEEITVYFGYCETNVAEPLEAPAPEPTVREAVELIEGWLTGEIRTVVYTDAAGNWCGSFFLNDWDDEDEMLLDGAQRLGYFKPTTAEVRSSDRKNWWKVEIPSEWWEPPLPPRRVP